LFLALGCPCRSQDAQKRSLPPECTKTIRVNGAFPTGPFKILPNETYKRPPFIRYQIQEDGAVSDAVLVHSSGVADVDKKVVDAVRSWKYQARPTGCGVIETKMSVVIDWAAAP
jgi:TonB family protein